MKPDTQPAAGNVSSRTRRLFVLVGVMMAMATVAIEATIVATALPSIVARLGGFEFYTWVFSAYSLMQAVSVPIYGKLSDLFGRKPVFITGVGIFLVASLACGFAPSLPWLIGFRLLQGLGAGAVLPVAVTIIGDTYTLEERNRVQGWLSSVWGIAAILGPLAGATIVELASWSWVFWVNIPFGLASMLLIGTMLRENVAPRRTAVDYGGAMLLFLSLGPLMLALTHAAEWPPLGTGVLIVAALAFGCWFFAHERRVAAPIVDPALLGRRIIAQANAVTLLTGIGLMGLIGFLPTFLQGALGRSATVAGLAMSAMSLGWPLASIVTGRLLARFSARPIARAGGLALVVGALIVAFGAKQGAVAAALGSFIFGVGLGVLNLVYIVSIQSSVDWAERGAATASNSLARILGGTLGAALFGGVVNFSLQRSIETGAFASQLSLDHVRRLLGDSGGNALTEPALNALRAGLSTSLQLVFAGIALTAAMTLAVCWSTRNVTAPAGGRPG